MKTIILLLGIIVIGCSNSTAPGTPSSVTSLSPYAGVWEPIPAISFGGSSISPHITITNSMTATVAVEGQVITADSVRMFLGQQDSEVMVYFHANIGYLPFQQYYAAWQRVADSSNFGDFGNEGTYPGDPNKGQGYCTYYLQ